MTPLPRTQLRPLPLQELRALAEGVCWQVDQPIAHLSSLTPVRGSLQALLHGHVLELRGQAETILTLCCDRCLQDFNHPLKMEAQEMLELRGTGEEEAALEPTPLGEDLDDRLDPGGTFDPERWIFEQLSLQLPLVNRCGDDCPGPARWSSDPEDTDPRWGALRALRPN